MIPPENAPATSRIGTVISDRYRILELLGEGGMGAVYLAEHVHMKKRVALKLLHPEMSDNAEVQSRFEREAMAASHVEHPNVAAATDFGRTADGAYFLVLEYVEGTSLRDVLAKGPISVARALRIGKQIAYALERAHDAGIVHRDLKPENVMLVSRAEEPDFVKVLDFGIAKVMEIGAAASHMAERQQSSQPLTRLGTILGTPEYMAPEQALGEAVAPAADLYAVGVMLYEMMTGLHPFDPPDRTAMLSFHIVAPVPRMEDRAPEIVVPEAVEAIVRRLLEKESKKRYASARELADAIEQAERTEAMDDVPAPPASLRNVEVFAQTALGTPPPVTGAYRDAPARDVAAPSAGPTSTMDTLRRQPNRVKLAVLAALPLGFIVIVLVAVLARGKGSGRIKGVDGAAPAEAGEVATRLAPESRVKAAIALGPEALEALGKEFPDDASLLPRLAVAQQAQGRTAEALRTVRAAIAAHPEAVNDDELVDLVSTAAARGKGEDDDEAFALLEGPLGARGVDALIELASGKTSVKVRATRSLARPEVRAHASPAAAAFLDLKAATTCTAKHDVLPRVKESGDARVAPALKTLKATRGCGFLGRNDCWACLRRDGALEEATTAVETRGAPRP
ncbi:MAG: serine/threonine protein kinase [Labilithrix sp.]|nr:serine/threonine protein kinase [Labilithrix sp.]